MRNTQTADGGPPIVRQNTPDAPAETLSEINSIPMIFSLNQSSAMCLPVVSDSQRLIWVHANQMEQNLEAAAELGKEFDKFPYLTQKQTAALAGRCSLHPDQVKVWFMVQRLRFGISWDYRDIRMVRNQFKSNQGKKKEEKTDGGEKKTRKMDVKKSGGNKVRRKLSKEQSSIEGGMVGENVRAYEQMEKNMKLEQQIKKEKDGKRKRRKVTANMGEEHAEEKATLPAKIRCPAKTQTQVEMMRMAFLHCQYPDSNEYEHLSWLIGVSRYLLVQWFGDTRYHIKKGRPRWMSEKQHCRTLANVEYRQYLKKLERLQEVESPRKRTQKPELDGSVTCGEETGERGPTESP
ncbi:homeobox and leucine zipper encoding b [Labrus mixtus]|uniref:homeobox and leucine zipper encoding b n=1 Tax=Labrus mixtus TaxID=508554 RepID=UPI0029C0F33E|nr:homeobox and leucine zipper encoding b [Labrus mixtus]